MSIYQPLPSDPSEVITILACACTACSGNLGSTAKHKGDLASIDPDALASSPVSLIGAGSTAAVSPVVALNGTLSEPNQVDFYSFDLVAGQTYLFSVRGTGTDPVGDTFMYIFDGAPAADSLITIDDDGGDGVNSLITFTAATTGTYTVGVGAYPDSGLVGTYTFDAIEDTGVDAVPEGTAGAPLLPEAGTIFGFIDEGTNTTYGSVFTEVDSYTLSVEAGKYYTIEMAGGYDYLSSFGTLAENNELDTVLVLYGPSGQVIAVNDDAGPGEISSSISFLAAESGTYRLDAFSYAGLTGGYSITTREIDLSQENPLDSIDWRNADDVPFVDVGGVPTAYVYFGDSDENFNQLADDGVSPLITFDWNDFEKGQIMVALEEYEHILGVNYEITEDLSQATFRLLKAESAEYGAYFYPQDPGYGDEQGVGVFNILSGGWSFDRQQSLERGGYSFGVILHEFGHAHGLAHPHDRGGGSDIMIGVTAATGSYGVYNLNQGVYTVMSYNDAWDFHPDGPSVYSRPNIDNGWSGSLSAFDIAQLQIRYGVHAYNEGDNVYTLTDVVDDAFYQTIWDSGGTDTIAYAGSLKATIDLLAATLDYSPTGGGVVSYLDAPFNSPLRGGYTIANGVVIENATGGSGNDTLLGNEADNVLTGNAGADTFMGRGGDDTILGGDGNDTLMLSGDRGDYLILRNADGSLTITDRQADRDGIDTVSSIEQFTFADGNVSLFQLNAGNIVRGTTGNDDLRGLGQYENYFFASTGNDILRGAKFNDILLGGGGDDQMYGGGGADQFRFFGDQIDGSSDRDRIYDLTFSDGDELVFGDYGAGTFTDSANVNAFAGGASAIIASYQGLFEADLASDLVTVTRQSVRNNNLLLTVRDSADGQVQEILISDVWDQYAAANGLGTTGGLLL